MQLLARATFVQPNLSFSTKINYSIMMENMEIFILNKLALNMQARPWYLI